MNVGLAIRVFLGEDEVVEARFEQTDRHMNWRLEQNIYLNLVRNLTSSIRLKVRG